MFIRALERRAATGLRDSFAGVARAADGSVEVFAVGDDPQFVSTLNEIRADVAPQLSVRVEGGRRYSLAALNQLRDEITRDHDALVAAGVTLVEWGVDIRANNVRIGVLTLTPDIEATLESRYGTERISVTRGQLYGGTIKTT